MKTIRLSLLSAALFLISGIPVHAAEMVGKVLVAVGDTTALRNGIPVKLDRGAEVQSGDTLRVGDASNMQVRFTDDSITALRPNTVFRIDDYKFEAKTNVGSSFFSLVKGGMRAITGLIGRYNRENYAVKATTATIGIRGTHFVLAQCSGDCFNKDGSKAEDGLFGGVTDGRIAVTNKAGEKEFGKNEFFHVASADVSPKPLLAPPSFLRDQLEGQSKNKEEKKTAAASQGGETAGTATALHTSTAVTTQPTVEPPAPVQVAADTQYTPNVQDVVQTNVSGGALNTVAAGQSFSYQFAITHAFAGTNVENDPYYGSSTNLFGHSDALMDQGTMTVTDPTKLMQGRGQDVLFADLALRQATMADFLMNPFSGSATLYYYRYTATCGFDCPNIAPDGTASYSWSKSASTDTGSDAAANLKWGRYTWNNSETVLTGSYAGRTNSETNYEHWATGDILNVAALPTSGTYSYAHVGGTRPTDQNGNAGTITSGGTASVTFNGTSPASFSLLGVSWNMPVTNNTYNLSFSNQPITIQQQTTTSSNPGWTATGTETKITTVVNINAGMTCSGACSNFSTPIPVAVARVAPMLFGTSAQGLAAGISTSLPTPVGSSPAEHTASVQVYKR